MPPPPRQSCPHNLPWIPNRFQAGGFNCAADLCYLDPHGSLHFRDNEDEDFPPVSRRELQREALLEMANRDVMRRTAREFARGVDRGAEVLFSGEGVRDREFVSSSGLTSRVQRESSKSSSRMHKAEKEEKVERRGEASRPNREGKEEEKSLLKKLFTKMVSEEKEGLTRRHTGIEPDGAWSLPSRHESEARMNVSKHEKSSSRHENSRHESVRRERSKRESSSRHENKTSSKREPSRHDSIKPPSKREPSKHEPSRHSSSNPKSTTFSRYATSIAPPPTHHTSSSSRKPTKSASTASKSKVPSTPPHEKEISNWEERKKAAEKGVSKSGKTVMTQGYKLGNMARTIVEGQL